MSSVLSQDWPSIELIVVDDASTDQSLSTARRMAGPNTKVIMGDGKGASAARNIGLGHVNGEYIKFLDADDILSAGTITAQVNKLRKAGEDFVCCGPWMRFTGRVPKFFAPVPEPVWKITEPVSWLVSSFTGGGMMCPGCWLVPAAILRKSGNWDATHVKSQNDDTEFFTRVLLQSAGIVFSDDAKLYYRSDVAGALSQDQSSEARKARLDAYYNIKKTLLAHENSPRTRHAVTANFARFVYEIAPNHPDLVILAQREVDSYDGSAFTLFPRGKFRTGSALIGYKNMLRIRRMIRKLTKNE